MVSSTGTEVGSPKDRRRAARQALVTKALVVREREGRQPIRATLADVSLDGLSFDSPVELEVGCRCRVRVEAGPMQMSARLQVVNCRKQGDAYRVGCQFVRTELELADRATTRPKEAEPRSKPVALPRNACRDLRPQPAAR